MTLPVDFARLMEQRGYPTCRCVDKSLTEGRESAPPIAAAAPKPAVPLATDDSLEGHIARIAGEYHDFLFSEVPLLTYLLSRVVDKHAVHYPELWEFQGIFAEFEEQLTMHLTLEQHTLFPMLKAMESQPGSSVKPRDRENISASLGSLWRNHEYFREATNNLRSWTHNFAPPDTACTVYRVVLQGMAELTRRLELCMEAEEELYARALAYLAPSP